MEEKKWSTVRLDPKWQVPTAWLREVSVLDVWFPGPAPATHDAGLSCCVAEKLSNQSSARDENTLLHWNRPHFFLFSLPLHAPLHVQSSVQCNAQNPLHNTYTVLRCSSQVKDPFISFITFVWVSSFVQGLVHSLQSLPALGRRRLKGTRLSLVYRQIQRHQRYRWKPPRYCHECPHFPLTPSLHPPPPELAPPPESAPRCPTPPLPTSSCFERHHLVRRHEGPDAISNEPSRINKHHHTCNKFSGATPNLHGTNALPDHLVTHTLAPQLDLYLNTCRQVY